MGSGKQLPGIKKSIQMDISRVLTTDHMKIFYITYKNDYSTDWEKTGRYSNVYDTTYTPLVKIAGERGHTIRPFWVDEIILEKGEAGMNAALRDAIIEEKPDVCFFDTGMGESLNKEVLEEIKKKSSAVTVYICADDSWNFDHESKHFAPYFSWIATSYSRAIKRYRALGCQQVILWAGPGGVSPDFFKNRNFVKDIDVSFLGTWGPPRGKTIQALQEAGINVLARGNGWPGGGVSQEEWNSIISRSKISLCLNEAPFYIGWRSIARLFFRRAWLGESGSSVKIDVHNFLDNVRTWWQKRIPNIKARHFEIPALRTMQITQHADNLEEYFVPGKEIVFYTDTKDLIGKIRYYLAHDEECEAIAKAGYERVLRDHTREKRLYYLFSAIGQPL